MFWPFLILTGAGIIFMLIENHHEEKMEKIKISKGGKKNIKED